MNAKDSSPESYEKGLNKFKKKYDEYKKDITECCKILDEVLSDVEQANWGELNRVRKGNIPSMYHETFEATYELVESIREDSEVLQHNYQELDFIRKQILNELLKGELDNNELNSDLKKYIEIMNRYFDVYMDYKYILYWLKPQMFSKKQNLYGIFLLGKAI